MTGVSSDDVNGFGPESGSVRTTTVASATSASVEEDRASVGRRAMARYTVQLIGIVAFGAAALLGGIRLAGFAWQVGPASMPTVTAANRAQLSSLIATRALGQNAPPIAGHGVSPMTAPVLVDAIALSPSANDQRQVRQCVWNGHVVLCRWRTVDPPPS
jgi:hypothetical protein